MDVEAESENAVVGLLLGRGFEYQPTGAFPELQLSAEDRKMVIGKMKNVSVALRRAAEAGVSVFIR